jgi:hypothetical protein
MSNIIKIKESAIGLLSTKSVDIPELFSTNPTQQMTPRDPNALNANSDKPTNVKSRMLAEM